MQHFVSVSGHGSIRTHSFSSSSTRTNRSRTPSVEFSAVVNELVAALNVPAEVVASASVKPPVTFNAGQLPVSNASANGSQVEVRPGSNTIPLFVTPGTGLFAG